LQRLPGGRFALKTGGRLSAGNYSAVDLLDIRQVDFSQGIVDLIDVLSDEGWLGHRIEERVAQIHETVDGSRNQGLRKVKTYRVFRCDRVTYKSRYRMNTKAGRSGSRNRQTGPTLNTRLKPLPLYTIRLRIMRMRTESRCQPKGSLTGESA
jgi:hypothetical protein